MGILANENAISGGNYQIVNSLRFQSVSSQYLVRTPASASNRKTWTWSGWVKRGTLSADGWILGSGTTAAEYTGLVLNGSTNALQINVVTASTNRIVVSTNAVFRDPSAWYHIVLAVDTTQATNSNGVKIYVNGVQQVLTYTTYTQNVDTSINNTVVQEIGRVIGLQYFDGYMAEVNFVDGQQLTPSSFGSTDTTSGQWVAKKYAGTYGTNGFYLPFSNGTSTTTLGADSSGNSNNWTLTNFTRSAGVSDCWMTDVPSGNSSVGGNYCVLNAVNSSATLSQANLKSVEGASGSRISIGTIGMTTGKWYWEVTAGSAGLELGVGTSQLAVSAGNLHATGYGWGYNSDGNIYPGAVSGNATYTTNDVIGLAFNADTGVLSFYKNNTLQPTTVTGLTSAPYFPASGNGTGATNLYNFGQRSFAYTPPTGFKALCTANLPVATIKQGNKYMDATTYTGNGGTQSIVNAGAFQPDLVWCKQRNAIDSNLLFDSVRGATKWLSSNVTNAEGTVSGVSAFNSNGFTLGGANVNTNGDTFVGWQWQAGQGSTSSNTNGSITSTTSVSATAGFSVVTYTGTGANATVGHGLGIAPKMLIIKSRSTADTWRVYHDGIGNTKYINLNDTSAAGTASTVWNNTSPTSTVFTVGTESSVNGSGRAQIAYCFAEIAGFSKFGSYTGNGSADGVFVYTGFKPKYVMVKRTDTTSGWSILDTARNPYNVSTTTLRANVSDAETTGLGGANTMALDFTSNGFKFRDFGAGYNASGGTYIYACFAENPFAQSNAA